MRGDEMIIVGCVFIGLVLATGFAFIERELKVLQSLLAQIARELHKMNED